MFHQAGRQVTKRGDITMKREKKKNRRKTYPTLLATYPLSQPHYHNPYHNLFPPFAKRKKEHTKPPIRPFVYTCASNATFQCWIGIHPREFRTKSSALTSSKPLTRLSGAISLKWLERRPGVGRSGLESWSAASPDSSARISSRCSV